MPSVPANVLAGLAVVWLAFLARAFCGSRKQRRGLAVLGITGSLLTFLPIWWAVNVVLTQYLFDSTASILPAYLVMDGMMLTVAAFFGIVSVWAALGRPHWFLRMLVVGGLLGLILLAAIGAPKTTAGSLAAPVYGIWYLYLVQSAVAISLVLLARHLAGWTWNPNRAVAAADASAQRPLQFRLRDLLFLMLLTAAILAIASFAPEETWGSPRSRNHTGLAAVDFVLNNWYGHCGAILGLATFVAAWVALSRRPAWLRAMGAMMAWPLLPCLLWLGLWRASLRRGGRPLVRALAWSSLSLWSALIVVPTVILLWNFVVPPAIPRPPFADSGESDTLERMAKPWKDLDIPDDLETSAGRAKMKAFAEQYRSELEEVHAALRQPPYQALRYRSEDMETSDRFTASIQLARALRLAAAVAAEEQRYADAIRSCHGLLRLAQATARGRLITDTYTAWCGEDFAIDALQRMSGSLDPEQRQQAIEMLAGYDREREPSEVITQRDQIWTAHAFGPLGRLYAMADGTVDWLGHDFVRSSFRWRALYRQLCMRSMMTQLALQGHRSEHNEFPARLDELVPAWLPQVPLDPTTNQPLNYQRTDAGFQITSPGFNGPWVFPVPVPATDTDAEDE